MSQKVQVILEVTGKGIDTFSKVSGHIDRFTGKVSSAFHKVVNLPNLIAGTAVAGITATFVKANMEMQALENRLGAAIGKFTDTAEEMSYLRSEADRTGQNFRTLTDSYAGFSAATTRAGISVEETREIFKNFNETAISLKLSNEKTKLVFMALEQMASKGKVSMEELRRQLGDSLPGALEIAAKSMGMTTAAFNDAVSKGEIMSADFLPKFSRAVREELGGSFDTASEQLTANLNRMFNAFWDLKQEIGEAINPVINEIVPKLRDKIKDLAQRIVENKDKITDALSKVPELFDKVLDSITKLATYMYDHRDAIYMTLLIAGFTKAVVVINNFRIAFMSLNMVMAANPILAVAGALAALGIAAGLTGARVDDWKKSLENNTELKNRGEQIVDLTDLLMKYNQQLETAVYDDRMGLIIQDNKKLQTEIAMLEDNLGNFGIALEGGLLDKIEQVEQKLDELQGKTRKTSESVKGAFEGITPPPPTPPKPHELPYKMQNMYDYIMSGGALDDARRNAGEPWKANILQDMEKNYDDTLNRLMLRYGDFSVQMSSATELLAIRMKDIWSEFTDSLEGRFKGMYDTLTDLNSTWNEKLVSIGQQAYKAMTDLLWKYLSAYVKAKMEEGTIGIATEKKKQIEGYKTAAADGAGAAAGAGKAVANTPYVGPILAVAAIATVFAAIAAMISKAKGYAIGTNYAPPGYAWVGERGPELMRMRGGEQIIPADKSARMGGGVNINLTVNGNMDKQTADYTVNRLRQFADDYNNAMRYKYLNPGLARY